MSRSPVHQPRSRSSLHVGPGVTSLLVLALVVPALLGTVGYAAVGMGVMTDCTTYYEECCDPCAPASHWLLAGALFQGALVLAVAVLWRWSATFGLRAGRLAAIGATALVLSVMAIVLSDVAASNSYCRPGAAGYERSYCSIRE